MIKLLVNGKPETLDRAMTIADYLKYRDYDIQLVVIEWNFAACPRAEWHRTYLEDGGNLEIIKIVGGG